MRLGCNLGTSARDLESIIAALFLLYSDKPMWFGTSAISPFIVLFLLLLIYFFYNPLFSLSFLLNCTCSSCLDIEE